MVKYLSDFDLSLFWENSAYALKEYVCTPLTDELITSVEQELGYKLPQSYIELMKVQNGGIPVNTCFPTKECTAWAEDHIAISGIIGIGRDKYNSLCGEMGSKFMIEEWGYPDFGVVICDCPSAGHDLVMLDYRKCGRDGEPEVVHVDQESDYKITFLAKNFETFIRELVNEEVYDDSEEVKQSDLAKVANGAFSPLLAKLCAQMTTVNNLEQKIRAVCTKIVENKGFFALHCDELSLLMYDLQFWLYSNAEPCTTKAKYLDDYKMILVFSGEFKTGGYAPDFISDWLNNRIDNGMIVEEEGIIRFSQSAAEQLVSRLNAASSN